ncbi:MAG: DUF4276 family protein [Methanophagales archaeon ANME-1-THS]|nr:MAG: DUF4276 family protein [Methanophagales archaeon ANME-1-THS]
MMGVIVEGTSDEKVIREITTKLGINAEIRMSRRGAKIQSPKKTKSFVDLLHDCDKIVILKDSHCSDPEAIESNLRKRLRELGLSFDGNIRICIVVHAIESWLLADEEAIGDYLGSKVKEVLNPENACKPEEVLDGIFKKNGREYLKGGEAPRELAKRLRLEKVITKCPSFIKFKAFIG